MSTKLTMAFVLAFFLCALIAGVVEGGGGVAVTSLTANVSDAATTLNVVNTRGFLKADYITIDNEKIRHVNTTGTTFIVASTDGRGYDSTAATSHTAGTKVYGPNASVLNSIAGFNVATTGGTAGEIYMFVLLKNFFFITLPKLAIWDFGWLTEGNMIYLRMFFVLVTIGFTVTVALAILNVLGGVAQSIFRLP